MDRALGVIVLDTNVISELMRPSPSNVVEAWLVRHGRDDFHTTVMCQAEVLAGIALLPVGRRHEDLHRRAEWVFAQAFTDKILSFDSETPPHFAQIVAMRQRAGRRIAPSDAVIAAIARQHGAAIATRNLRDFEGCGVELHDPWRGG